MPFLCFVSGTWIRTVRGDVPIEDLHIGEHVITASGDRASIVWMGHKVVDCASCRFPSDVWPVRVAAGAFGSGLPERTLLLSPGHPVVVAAGVDEVLVPIMCLINGTLIARVPVDRVTYWHIELDRHDIVLAEGLPAESFLDFGCRTWFENGADHSLTNPDFIPPGLNGRCLPVVTDGPIVEAERQRLDAVFAAKLNARCAWSDADSFAWLAA